MHTDQLTTMTEAAAELRDGWRRLHERIESGNITIADLQREVEQASYAAEEMWRALTNMRNEAAGYIEEVPASFQRPDPSVIQEMIARGDIPL